MLIGCYQQASLQKGGDSYRTMKTNHTVYIHPASSLFQHQPPVKTVLYYELVMTSKSYMRQVMEIKPQWLLEGPSPTFINLKPFQIPICYPSRTALLQGDRSRATCEGRQEDAEGYWRVKCSPFIARSPLPRQPSHLTYSYLTYSIHYHHDNSTLNTITTQESL